MIVQDQLVMHATTTFQALVDIAETTLLIQTKTNCSATIGICKTGMDVVTNVLLRQAGPVPYLTLTLTLLEMMSSHHALRVILETLESILFIMSNVMKDLILKSTELMRTFTSLEVASMDGSKKTTFVILTMVNVRNLFGSRLSGSLIQLELQREI